MPKELDDIRRAIQRDNPAMSKSRSWAIATTAFKKKHGIRGKTTEAEMDKHAFEQGFADELAKIADLGDFAGQVSDFAKTPHGAAALGAVLGTGAGAGIGALTGPREERAKRMLLGGGIGAALGGGAGLGAQQLGKYLARFHLTEDDMLGKVKPTRTSILSEHPKGAPTGDLKADLRSGRRTILDLSDDEIRSMTDTYDPWKDPPMLPDFFGPSSKKSVFPAGPQKSVYDMPSKPSIYDMPNKPSIFD